MFDGRLLAWIGVAGILVILPGPDMTMVLRSGLRGGRVAALATAYGINAGLVAWTAASALGVAALLATSATAFTVLKVAGAAYLAYAGTRMLVRSFREHGSLLPVRREREPLSTRAAFRAGLLCNLLNPKIAATFTTLLPQFVDKNDPAVAKPALLAAIFLAMGLVWLTVYALLIGRAAELFQRASVRTWIERVTAFVFLGFAVQLAFQRR
jgi:threonine/homoserine/homoserine lactone efflux protein